MNTSSRTQALMLAFAAVALIPAAAPRLGAAEPAPRRPPPAYWKMGLIIRARGACTGVTATVPVPKPWPEQQVRLVRTETSSPSVRTAFRDVGQGGARQMVITISRLAEGQTVTAAAVYEVVKPPQAPPAPNQWTRRPRRPSRSLARHLGPSPMIESRDRRIVALAEHIAAGRDTAWEEVKAIYDWVRANIRYQFDPELKGALAALDARQGDCEELTSLFVALCRARGVPARSVWVPGHCYPEFYLEDARGSGRWLPCQAAGAEPQFGWIDESRPILQKGDLFRIPGLSAPQRYVQPTLTARRCAAPPEIEWIQQQLADEDRPAEGPADRESGVSDTRPSPQGAVQPPGDPIRATRRPERPPPSRADFGAIRLQSAPSP